MSKLILFGILICFNFKSQGQSGFYYYNEYSLDLLKSGFNSYLILIQNIGSKKSYAIIDGYSYHNIKVMSKTTKLEFNDFIDSLLLQNRQQTFLMLGDVDVSYLKSYVVNFELINREYWPYKEDIILNKFFKDSILIDNFDNNLKSTLLFYFLAKGYYIGIDIHNANTYISLFNPEKFLKDSYSLDTEIVYQENGDLYKINLYEKDKVVSVIDDISILKELQNLTFFDDKPKLRKYIIEKKYNK